MTALIRSILARILFSWGSLHRNFGNKGNYLPEHRAAIRRFSQAYELDPTLRQAKLDRAIILYREMGLHDEALTEFNELLDEDPQYGPALLNRAMIAQEQGDYPAALSDLEIYLELPEKDEKYWQIASRTTSLLREIVSELGT